MELRNAELARQAETQRQAEESLRRPLPGGPDKINFCALRDIVPMADRTRCANCGKSLRPRVWSLWLKWQDDLPSADFCRSLADKEQDEFGWRVLGVLSVEWKFSRSQIVIRYATNQYHGRRQLFCCDDHATDFAAAAYKAGYRMKS